MGADALIAASVAQADEWLTISQALSIELVAHAEAACARLFQELDAAALSLDSLSSPLPAVDGAAPAPAKAHPEAPPPKGTLRPADQMVEERYPTLARVTAAQLQRLPPRPQQPAEPAPSPDVQPPPAPSPDVQPPPAKAQGRLWLSQPPTLQVGLLPSPLAIAALRHLLMRDALLCMGKHAARRSDLAGARSASQRHCQASTMGCWRRHCETVKAQRGEASLRRAWRAWWMRSASVAAEGAARGEALQRCRARDSVARWRAAAGDTADAELLSRAASVHSESKSGSAALRRWRLWSRHAQQWRHRAGHRSRATGGVLKQHLPLMAAFDARATFVELGSAEMADAYRRRRTTAVAFCGWAGSMYSVGT